MEDYLKAPGLCSLGQLPKEMPRRPSPPLWLLTSDLILPTPGPQNVYYTSSQQIHVGILSPTVDDDDNRCLVDVNSRPRLIECSYARAKRMKLHWQFSQGGPIQNRKSKRCLELQENSEAEFGFQLVLQRCSGQHWSITNVLRSLAS